jgi:hypothetical protein
MKPRIQAKTTIIHPRIGIHPKTALIIDNPPKTMIDWIAWYLMVLLPDSMIRKIIPVTHIPR